ncbi:hypothetical protein ABBQ38_001970 [Trebouxia sp. C0009 RCD-2024]
MRQDMQSEEEGSAAPSAPVKKAAAAMAVGVGSFKDPDQLQGLSHYLEHMLFMGSKKYPDENEYDSYLTKHGGASNAFTELEFTNYHFDVKPNALYGALDRFAQFFIDPLCKADALEREVMAVDNEFSGVLQSDGCRLSQLRCHTAQPGHIYNKFSWGNRRSLFDEPKAQGIAVRDELVKYYRQQYSAERMSLVVLGGQPLEELQHWVTDLFSSVPSGKGPRPTYFDAGMPYKGGQVTICPSVKEGHQVMALFQLPSLTNQYRSKADEYISHLVGHEGKGSLLSALKAKGWASELSAGVGESGYDRNTAAYVFEVHMNLTQAGFDTSPGNGLAVMGLLFQFLSLLKAQGPQKWVFDELANIAQMRFKFAEEEDACEYALRLAADAPYYAPEHLLNGHYLYDQWDPQLVDSLLGHMTPSNVRVDVQTSSFSSTKGADIQQEPWFGMPYASSPIPPELLHLWATAPPSPELQLPPKNDFIPTDFALRSDDTPTASTSTSTELAPTTRTTQSKQQQQQGNKVAQVGEKHSHNGKAVSNGHVDESPAHSSFPTPPEMILDDPGLRLWHKLDRHFQTPKAAAYFCLTSAAMYDSPAAAAATHLLMKLLEDALCETAYLADVAGLSYDMWPEGQAGVEIKVDGFSHKLPLLVDYIFQQLVSLKVDPARFDRVREGLLRRYKNANFKPDKHATYLRIYAIKQKVWPVEQVHAQLEALTPTTLQELLPKILSAVFVEGLVHGNLTSQDAVSLGRKVQATLASAPVSADDRPRDRVLQLPAASLCYSAKTKNPEEGNSVVELYVQIGTDDLAKRSMLDMVDQVLHEPCYDTLRTKQQLGYSVHSGVRLTHGILGFAVCVVSGTHDPVTLQERIEAFLDSSTSLLAELQPEDFERHRQALIAAKLQQCHSLLDESDKHWEQIQTRRYNFTVRQQEVEQLKALTVKQIRDFYVAYIPHAAKGRRSFTVHILSSSHEGHASQEMIDDLDKFKTGLEECALPKLISHTDQ